MIYGAALAAVMMTACGDGGDNKDKDAFAKAETPKVLPTEVEQVADLKILRYDIPGFQDLTLKEQKLVYYL